MGVATIGAPFINLGRTRLSAATTREYSARAVDLVERARVVDMLGLLTMDWAKLARWHREPTSFTAADYEFLRSSGIRMFHPAVDLNTPLDQASDNTRRWLNGWTHFLSKNSAYFTTIRTLDELQKLGSDGKIGVLLGMQNSDHFRTPADVDLFYGMGQRVSQLTYNARNALGSGCTERSDTGLSVLGHEVAERMNHLGMIIDISHAGERTSLDTCAASKRPVLITHSNCRTLVSHPRCKSDEVIRAVAKSGGVMGITGIRNFAARSREATVEDVLDHFDYTARLTGVEHVGIGSDTGLGGPTDAWAPYIINDLNHPLRIYEIADGLIRRGYSNLQIELMLGGNFSRVLESTL